MSESLQISSICNRSAVLASSTPQMVYVLTELTPGPDITGARLPLNFSLVLDRSGSMAGEKIRTMREAVKNIIDQLTPEDIISIVIFESRTSVLVPAQAVMDKAELKRQVEKIRDGGGTNMAPGLQEGLNQVKQNQKGERVSRIILLTDGEATDSENDSRRVADQAGQSGAPIIGLGFGRDWKHDFLIDLADRSLMAPGSQTGYVDYIPSPDQVNRIFQEVYKSMQVVAQDVTLTTRMVQGVEARRAWQVVPMIREIGQNVIQGRAVVIPVGQLEKGGVAFLTELILPPRPEGQVRIAQTDVMYTLPGAEPAREAVDLILKYTPDKILTETFDSQVMNVVEKVQAFRVQTQALDLAEKGDVSGATQKLRQAVTILLSQGETELARQMQQEADNLEKSGELSSEGKKTIKLTSRKTVKLSGS
ncbi:MAG: von Willebrand factor type [Chloroflexi bacterium]|nr:von Willebrand factor type [Chloroflexota bacterium]